MTTKYSMTFSLLIIGLTIFSCINTDNSENNLIDKSKTTETKDKNQKEIETTNKIGGVYSFGDNIENGPIGSVIIYPVTENSALFFLDVCRGAPSYNLGQIFGQMNIEDNIGTYDSKIYDDYYNCILKFKFSEGQLEVTTESGHEDCGFGGNVSADNIYKLIDKSLPKYFINGEGDTISFNGMTVEKYNHRND